MFQNFLIKETNKQTNTMRTQHLNQKQIKTTTKITEMIEEEGYWKRKRDDDESVPPSTTSNSMFVHDNNTDLHLAIAEVDIPAVRNLLDAGHKLCYGPGDNCFIKLGRMNKWKLEYLCRQQKCPSIELAFSRKWQLMSILLQHEPAGVNARDIIGTTLLMLHMDKPEHFKLLLKSGADPQACTVTGRSVLMQAAENAKVEVISELLQHEIDVNAQDDKGKTALIYAMQCIRSRDTGEKIRVLLDAGADPNIEDNNGFNPFVKSISSYFVNPTVTDLLLKAGAIVNLKSPGRSKHILHQAYEAFESSDRKEQKIQMFATLYRKLIQVGVNPFEEIKCLSNLLFRQIPLDPDTLSIRYRQQMFTVMFRLSTVLVEEILKRENNLSVNYPQVHILWSLRQFTIDMDLLWPEVEKLLQPNDINELYVCVKTRFFTLGTRMDYELLFSNFVYYDTVSTFVDMLAKYNNVSQVQTWLKKLIEKGFRLVSSNPRVISPLTVLMQACFWESNQEHEAEMLQNVQWFIKEGINVSQKVFHFNDHNLNIIRNQLDVPDCLLVALYSGHSKCLRALLPYWSGHPLSLLLLLQKNIFRPANLLQLNELLKSQLSTLGQVAGPLNDLAMIHKIENQLASLSLENEEFCNVHRDFIELHREVPSLKMLSRTVVRSCVKSGNDLPDKLTSLVPPTSAIRAFVTMQPA